ncbi:MFS transporter [Mycolicibacterium murale]|uniref:MFS transporter n=1 Tax=Mycolicibacterium murale TaxID=182220 RepID=A0A7I9WQ77_9MYCO|nr:MFS transporter [Mycolicibacterium murale]GFG59528.1 MFS transporter [Mycolicibacterium murale]
MSPAPADRHARIAVGVLFLTNGAMFTNLVPRYPEIKASLEMSNTVFGLAVAAFPAGAMLSGLAAGALIRRFTSSRVAVCSSVMIATFTFVAGLAPAAWTFALAMFLAGTADAVTDVAQNAHALRVQRGYGRSIINSMHAVWSVGAVLGGAMGSAAIALGLDIAVQLAISGGVFGLMSLASYRFLLHGPDHDVPAAGPVATADPGEQRRTMAYLVLVVLAVLAIAGAAVEDAGQSWATLYLREDLGAPAAIAGFGFIALMGAQFVGRLLGDRVVDRFGERTVARSGAVLAGAGMGLALAWPTVPGTIAGFAAAGLGVATVVPAAFHAADNVRGVPPNTGLTVVTWLMRVGFLGAPPLVGAVADATSLRIGLLIVPVAGVLILLAAGVLRPKASGSRR